jgi:hypothetical protein
MRTTNAVRSALAAQDRLGRALTGQMQLIIADTHELSF